MINFAIETIYVGNKTVCRWLGNPYKAKFITIELFIQRSFLFKLSHKLLLEKDTLAINDQLALTGLQ